MAEKIPFTYFRLGSSSNGSTVGLAHPPSAHVFVGGGSAMGAMGRSGFCTRIRPGLGDVAGNILKNRNNLRNMPDKLLNCVFTNSKAIFVRLWKLDIVQG